MSLLPAPSLESVESALDEAERAVRASLPLASADVRDEYVWSRARVPLAELAHMALSYMPFFTADKDDDAGSLRTLPSDATQQATGQREKPHPTTTFAFLHALTVRLLRIEALLPPCPRQMFSLSSHPHRASNLHAATSSTASSLPAHLLAPTSPDALLSTLLPALLTQWDTLVARLGHAVNSEGRIFGQEVVLGWARALAGVGSAGATTPTHGGKVKDEERVVRQAMNAVRARLESELGWLVGLPQRQTQSQNQPQQQVQPSQQQQHPSAQWRTPAPSLVNRERENSASMDDAEEEL